MSNRRSSQVWLGAFVLALACNRGATPEATPPEPVVTAPADTPPTPPTPATPPANVGVAADGVACVGVIAPPPKGAVAETDPDAIKTLLAAAIADTDKGSLCTGAVHRVVEPIKVYRVWNSAKDHTQRGSWWSFDRPVGPREQYRRDNDICEDWSPLDRLIVCDLKVDARFVVGPGQSVRCEVGESHPKSAVNQVYIPNDGRNNVYFVEACELLGAWP